jgi:ribosomal protein S18 acetylase RimI-like enzyme
MTDELQIRPYAHDDQARVVELWQLCDLTRPWNDPVADIERCQQSNASELLVGEFDAQIAATVMCGDEGHRGWMYYVAVDPIHRQRGFGVQLVRAAEVWLESIGVVKVMLMVRPENSGVVEFYHRLDYEREDRVVMSRWLNRER